jgi:hypothetical protein
VPSDVPPAAFLAAVVHERRSREAQRAFGAVRHERAPGAYSAYGRPGAVAPSGSVPSGPVPSPPGFVPPSPPPGTPGAYGAYGGGVTPSPAVPPEGNSEPPATGFAPPA